MTSTRKTQKINTVLRQTIALICISIGIAISLAFWSYSRSMIISNADERLVSAVKFLHELLGDDFHDQIVDEQSLSNEEFLSIVDRNDDLCRRLNLQYLWSVLVHGDEIVFTSATRSNLQDPSADHASFFELHSDPNAFLPAIKGQIGKPAFSSFNNQWGRGRMVLLPRQDAHGRKYILGASIDLKRLNNLTIHAGLVAVISSMLLFTLVYFISVRHTNRTTRVFSDIAYAARKMKGGDLEVTLPETRITELQEVCHTIERFRNELKNQIEGLTHSNTREINKNAILSKVSQGADLQSLLDALVLFTEENDPSVRASILLYNKQRGCLEHASGPNLPEEYNNLVNKGFALGPNAGTCGSAAYLKQRVIVADVLNSPRWIPYPEYIEQARKHNLRACWSEPILSAEGQLLGTIANYSGEIGEPNATNLDALKWAADVAAIAIEKTLFDSAIRQSEEKFRSLANSAKVMISIIADKSGASYLYVNDEWCRVLGYSKEEILRMKPIDIVAPESRQMVLDNAAKRIKGEQAPASYELKCITKSGETKYLDFSSTIINFGDQKAFLTTAIDITDRKLADEALKASELRFRNILHNVKTVAVQGYTIEGKVIYWNQASTDFYGFTEKEAMGQNLLDLIIPPGLKEAVRNEIQTMKETGKAIPASEITLMRKDGSPITVYSSHSYVKVPGKDAEFFCIDTDLTERKKAEEAGKKLEIAQKTAQFKQNFLANMSHEIRTPLTGVLGMIDILNQTQLSEKQLDYLNIIKISGENLSEIINQVLDYSKIEAGKVHVQSTVFGFRALINDIENLYKNRLKKGVQLKVDLQTEIPAYIIADRFRLSQVMHNLVSNALKFTNKGGVAIRGSLVSSCPHNKKVLIKVEVADTGIGIPANLQDKLFVPFSQIDVSDIREYEGTGLGLSICKQLVELMGGEIGLKSQEGKGSTFWFTFSALAAQKPQRVVQEKATSLSAKKLHILLVEDKVVNQKVIKLMLNSLGHTLTIANNGKQALELFQPSQFDLILMDIQMPVMDGVAATQKLKEQYDNLPPIVGLSANAFEGDRQKYMALGMVEYLTKPVRKGDFENLIGKLFK